MARRTRIAAAKSLWADSLVKMLRDRSDFKMLESDLEIRHANGSLIRVGGFDDQERVDKILGTEYLHIFFNEATQISWATVGTVLTRLAQVVLDAPSHKAIFDCNPKSQRHWLYKAGILHQNPETQDGWTRLIICDSCQETISAFFDYVRQSQADGHNTKEAPLKDRDHAMDPIHYMVMKLDQCRGGNLAIPGCLPTK